MADIKQVKQFTFGDGANYLDALATPPANAVTAYNSSVTHARAKGDTSTDPDHRHPFPFRHTDDFKDRLDGRVMNFNLPH